jgi:hypothetical protein
MRMADVLTAMMALLILLAIPAFAQNETNATNMTNSTNITTNTTIPSNITNITNTNSSNQTNTTATTIVTNTTNTTVTNTTTIMDRDATITIKEWYPQMGAYVFECNTPGMTPDSYDWIYGDGSKSLGIANQNVFHTYLENGAYTVSCTAHEGSTTATASLSVGISDIPFRNTCSVMQNLGATCNGGTITQQELGKSCRTIICDGDGRRLTVLACDKPSADNPLYFEMYRKEQTGSGLEVCLGNTCIGQTGFARSPVQACGGTTTTIDTDIDTDRVTVSDTTNATNTTARVTICHKTSAAQQTITVSRSALAAHLRHGDSEGACVVNGTNTTANRTWQVTLTGHDEVPPNNSTGIGYATVVLQGGMLLVNGTFNLTSMLHETAGSPAHVHFGDADEAGPVVFPLSVSSDDNRSGIFNLTTSLNSSSQQDLIDGDYYLNVHSIEYPSGEIRAQIE